MTQKEKNSVLKSDHNKEEKAFGVDMWTRFRMSWVTEWLSAIGNLFSWLFSLVREFGYDRAKILMLGLDTAGKTTILYKVKLNKVVSTTPTIVFNLETVTPVKGLTLNVWDLGGRENTRALWRHHFTCTQGIFYVVDSADRERMAESREELQSILSNEEMKGVPVVVLANKQDLPGAASVSEIGEQLKLGEQRDRKWHIQGTCATTGEGVYEGMHEMARLVRDFKKSSGY